MYLVMVQCGMRPIDYRYATSLDEAVAYQEAVFEEDDPNKHVAVFELRPLHDKE